MMTRLASILLTIVLITSLAGRAETSPPAKTKPDYSHEASVLEQMSTKVAFMSDGNSTREQTTRVRVQTDAGIKQWGVLSFPYQSATQTVELDYVRVHKSDGSTIATPPDNVQDLDSEITRSAPFYSDLREKHVAVKGLGIGDVLEYTAHWKSTKSLIPGQFWFQYGFHDEGIVLDERLEVRVPADRAVKIKGPQSTQTVTTEGGSRIYTWTHSRLENTKEPASDEKKQTDTALGRLPLPEVEVSSFQSWDEVGRWYWNLQKDRIEPTPAIRAKAAELTKGLTDDDAKLRALYSFVSTHYRYIGIAFGIGRYQPHAADDVLSNNYGDCKDKHTLLASLAQAAGITLYPALISSSWKLDPDIPSPAQFNHVIGYLPQAKAALWLDTTPEVAPFGYLLQQLRDKQALVMMGDKSIQLVTTPADPPFPSKQTFKIDGNLSDDGTFDAKIAISTQGETEVFVRSAFRMVPQPQWKDLVQQISYQFGYSGTVSDVTASSPEAIGEPFHISYSYNRKDFPDWTNRQFDVPGHPFFMPPLRDDAKHPLWLGPPMETISDSRVGLPKGYHPLPVEDVDLNYDFAEYHATYSVEGDAMVARRRLLIKMHEVPPAKFDDYRSFSKNLHNDVNRYVQTSSSGASSPNPLAVPPAAASFQEKIRSLPDSASSEANNLDADARNKAANHDMPGAVASEYRAVQADPKFARAWVFLGVLLLQQNQVEAGKDAFNKAMAAEPKQPAIQKAFAFSLMGAFKGEDAIPVWQDFIKSYPDDIDGPTNLGSCLFYLKRYPEAAAAYEAAAKIKSDRPQIQMNLATAYLRAGEREKAVEAFRKLAQADREGIYFNGAAYGMANADLELPLALEYAQKALRKVEDDSLLITLGNFTDNDLGKISQLSAYWDTLGWVYERMSRLDVAEKYLRASWMLTQDGVVAGHLCHLYRRTHQNAKAIDMCKAAIYRMSESHIALDEYATESAAAKENLDHLTQGKAKSTDTMDASDLINRERTFKLPRLVPAGSAEFFVLLANDGKGRPFHVADVKFISGSDKLKPFGERLKSIDFSVPAPSEATAHFVRRGILGCYQYSGCSFVLLDPATVHSVN